MPTVTTTDALTDEERKAVEYWRVRGGRGGELIGIIDRLSAALDAARAEEREACATIADETAKRRHPASVARGACEEIERAIRARSGK